MGTRHMGTRQGLRAWSFRVQGLGSRVLGYLDLGLTLMKLDT